MRRKYTENQPGEQRERFALAQEQRPLDFHTPPVLCRSESYGAREVGRCLLSSDGR